MKNNQNTKTTKLIGLLAASVSAVAFGLAPIFAKGAYAGGSSELALTFWTLAFPVLPIGIIMAVTHIRFGLKKDEIIWVLLAGVARCMCMLCFNTGAKYLTSGAVTSLHYLYPAIVMISGILIFKQKLTWKKVLAAIVIMAGVFCFFEAGGSDMVKGSVLTIASAFCFATYTVIPEHTPAGRLEAIKLTFYGCLISAMILGAISIFRQDNVFSVPLPAWPSIILSALTSELIGTMLFRVGVSKAGAAQASYASTLEPLTSIVLGIILLGEAITLRVGAGCVLICTGVLLNVWATVTE